LIALAARHKLPTIYQARKCAIEGRLMSHEYISRRPGVWLTTSDEIIAAHYAANNLR
jgi:hypothetical protein